jgi:hypothetical protein
MNRATTEKRARKNFFMSRWDFFLNDAVSGVLTRKDSGIAFRAGERKERRDPRLATKSKKV